MKQLLKISTTREFLLNDPAYENYQKVLQKHGLSPDRWKEMLDLTNAVIDGVLPASETAHLLQEAFAIDEAKAKLLAADVLGYGVLPLENFIPGISQAITNLGGKIEEYPAVRVEKEKISSLAFAKRLTERVNITFSDVLMKRFAFLLEGRVKGEKNAEALKTFFGRSLSIGGLGLVKEQNDALIAAVEEEAPYIEIVSEEEYAKMSKEKEVEEVVEIEEDSEIEVSPSHELAVDVPVISHGAPRAPEPAMEVSEEENLADAEAKLLDKKFAALTKSAPKEKIQPVLPGARVSAARTKEDEILAQEKSFTPEIKKTVEEAERPKKAKAELTVGSVAPVGERKVTDVMTASRLVGPVEQLRSMTPVEFRRLSSNPEEAAQKVEDLISALESTSYEEKVKGIKAWRESPMNQLYLAITEEALSGGISLPEISSRRRASGKESLSPAEMKVLVRLNARLRF